MVGSFRVRALPLFALFVAVLLCVMPGVAQAYTSKTADEAIAWCQSKVGQKVGTGQCVALIKEYYSYLGATPVSGNANTYATDGAKVPAGWQKIQGATPQKGDILVYTGGSYGHVAIYASDSVTYHQNWPDGYYRVRNDVSFAKTKSRGYWGVIRPDFKSSVPTGSEISSGGERVGISSGTEYYLVSAVDTGQLLDVSGYPNASGNDTQLYHHLYNTEQVFRVYYTDGFYHLQDYDSGCWLDVDGGSMERGAAVQVWEGNGTKAQDWVIEDAGDGAYYLRSRLNGWYLDVLDGNSADETKVRLWEGNGSAAQKWYLVPHYTGSPETIEEGDYYIRTSLDIERALDVTGAPNVSGAKVYLWEPTYDDQQIFHVTRDDAGYYLLQDTESGCYLDVTAGSPANGALAQVYTGNGTAAQQWIIEKGDYGYTLRSRCSNFYLDVKDGSTEEGTEVRMWWGNGSAAQNWVFVSVTTPLTAKPSFGSEKIRYTGEALTPEFTVEQDGVALVRGTDYTWDGKYYSDVACTQETEVVDAGLYYVKVEGIGAYTGTKKASVRIYGANLFRAGKVTVGDASGWPRYTSLACEAGITVTAYGKTLTEGVDYTWDHKYYTDLNCKNETDASARGGWYYVKVEGIGNYNGPRKASFKVRYGSLFQGSIDAIASHVYDGKAYKPVPVVRNSAGVLLTKGVDYTYAYYADMACAKQVKTPTKAGTYYVKATAKSGSDYMSFKKKAFTITS